MAPADVPPEKRLVYLAAFESMAKAVDLKSKPELLAAVRDAGFNVERPEASYPPATLLKVSEVMVRREYPQLTRDVAYETLGRRVLKGYRTTIVGQVVFAALGLVGIEHVLKLAVRAFSTTSNFSRHAVEFVGPREAIYRSNSILPAPYVRGMLAEAIAVSKQPEAKLETLAAEGPNGAVLRITW